MDRSSAIAVADALDDHIANMRVGVACEMLLDDSLLSSADAFRDADHAIAILQDISQSLRQHGEVKDHYAGSLKSMSMAAGVMSVCTDRLVDEEQYRAAAWTNEVSRRWASYLTDGAGI